MNTPTTTERTGSALRLALGAFAALALWFLAVFATTLIVNPPTIVAFGNPDAILRAIAEAGGSPVGIGRGFVSARMPSAQATRALMGRGAWAVWPTTSGICVDPEVLRRAFGADA